MHSVSVRTKIIERWRTFRNQWKVNEQEVDAGTSLYRPTGIPVRHNLYLFHSTAILDIHANAVKFFQQDPVSVQVATQCTLPSCTGS
jgi:hypothetical protein